MFDLTSHDPVKRWTEEATHAGALDTVIQLGIESLEELSNRPLPWTEVLTGAIPPECWLLQGDLLVDLRVPLFEHLYEIVESEETEVPMDIGTFVVVTQSCDLENRKARMVACCPVHTLDEFEAINERFKKKGEWENVRRGKYIGLHLLPGGDPDNNRECLLVDFRVVHSLPFAYVLEFIKKNKSHFRLNSPYLEHMSQGLARVFMRVGLPTSIPKFE